MNITKEQLPVQEFERLGIKKDRLHQLPKDEMHALLSGYPSNMKFLTFKDKNGAIQKVNAKLSVYQTADGTIGLKVHPFRREIKNNMNLNQKEIDKLKSGESVNKTLNRQQFLVQLDQSINELRRIKIERIKVAGAVGSTKLSENQKADLKSGKVIILKDSKGIEKRIKLDLSSPSGISIEGQSQKLGKHKTSAQSSGENQESRDHRQQDHIRLKR